jgi:hypothetical protein
MCTLKLKYCMRWVVSSARFHPYSLSSLQLVLFLIPSLLYSSFSSLFPLFSTARSLPYSLSSLQLVLFPIPSLLYSSFSSLFPLFSTARSLPYSLSSLQLVLFPIPYLRYSSFSPLLHEHEHWADNFSSSYCTFYNGPVWFIEIRVLVEKGLI